MITLKNPLDMHLHLREGEILESVLPFSAQGFSGGVVMPNLKTPLSSTALALEYQAHITRLAPHFTPFMTIFLTPSLTREELVRAKEAGIQILKLYPKGSTTGSEGGVKEILSDEILRLFDIAQELGFILSIHGESGGFCMEREFEFLGVFEAIARDFPRLRTIIEHISDRRSLKLIESYPSLYGTLTLHHITLCLDDVCGGGLNPHLFCKPMLKTPRDRDALRQAALSAHPKLCFGSDSAPHLNAMKLRANGAAGIFSAPIVLPALAELFQSHNALEKLQAFVSDNAMANYGLQSRAIAEKRVHLAREEWRVPECIDTPLGAIVPLRAGEILSWRIKAVEA